MREVLYRTISGAVPYRSVTVPDAGRYSLTLEGRIDEDGYFYPDHPGATRGGGPDGRWAPGMVSRLRDRFERIIPAPPAWERGDVVIVRYYEGGPEYTFVRGLCTWPGETCNRDDAWINEKFREGLARPVLQAGGEPFDPERLKNAE